MTKARKIAVGDKVHYTAMFLRSTGQQAGDAGFRSGRIVELDTINGERMDGYAMVDWGFGEPRMVNCFNICRIGSSASYAS